MLDDPIDHWIDEHEATYGLLVEYEGGNQSVTLAIVENGLVLETVDHGILAASENPYFWWLSKMEKLAEADLRDKAEALREDYAVTRYEVRHV